MPPKRDTPLTIREGRFGLGWEVASDDEPVYHYWAQYAASGRAKCKRCLENIDQGAVRLGTPIKLKHWANTWCHPQCLRADLRGDALKNVIFDFNKLKAADRKAVLAALCDANPVRTEYDEELDDWKPSVAGSSVAPVTCLALPLLPFQQTGVGWMLAQEAGEVRGGILADEMGLGKTIQTIGLLLASKGRRKGAPPAPPTLIIAPASALAQWESEVNRFAPQLRVLVYHGGSALRKRCKEGGSSIHAELFGCDVVLTTYSVVEYEYREVVNAAKVPCEYCGKMYLESSLILHQQYFCGPNAKRTKRLALREKKNENGNVAMEKAKRTLGIPTSIPSMTNVYKEILAEAGRQDEAIGRYDKGARATRNSVAVQPRGLDALLVTLTKTLTFAQLKQRVMQHYASAGPSEQQKFVFNGHPIPAATPPATKLADLGIKPGDTLHVTFGRTRQAPSAPPKRSCSPPAEVSKHPRKATGKKASGGKGCGAVEVSSDSSDSSVDHPPWFDKTVQISASLRDAEPVYLHNLALPGKRRRGRALTSAASIATAADAWLSMNMGALRTAVEGHFGEPVVGWECIAADGARRCFKGLPVWNMKLTTAGVGRGGTVRAMFASASADEQDSMSETSDSSDTDASSSLSSSLSSSSSEDLSESVSSDSSSESQPTNKRRKPLAAPRAPVTTKPMRATQLVENKNFDVRDSILHSVEWGRLVVDEAHRIKARTNTTAKAVYALQGQFTWGLSGTPLQNRVSELFSLLRLVKVHPYAYYQCSRKGCECKCLDWKFGYGNKSTCEDCGHPSFSHSSYFNSKIMNPISRYGYVGEGYEALKTLRKVLELTQLRRTKTEVAADVQLPPLTIRVHNGELDERERDFYTALYKKSAMKFDGYVAKGTMLHNYAHIFELLARLRQAVDHPYLVTDTEGLMKAAAKGAATVCGVCNDPIDPGEDAVKAPCRHVFHAECIELHIQRVARDVIPCPGFCCSRSLTSEKLSPVCVGAADSAARKRKRGDEDADPFAPVDEPEGVMKNVDPAAFISSTKVEDLMKHVMDMPAGDKCIIFSQYNKMIDIVKWRLQRQGIRCVRLTGALSVDKRAGVIQEFNTDAGVRAILLSLRAGGEGINLQAANHVFTLDPWWNPAIEMQAIQRAHRIGQRKPVTAVRFVTKDTIEERMFQLQEKKQLVFDGTIDGQCAALSRLSGEDLAFMFNR